MSQTRKVSFIESWTNVAIGWGINYAANLVLIPLFFHTKVSLSANFWMGSIYTAISVVRSYCIRRWFNSREAK